MHNIVIQLVLLQCCKTRCLFMWLILLYLKWLIAGADPIFFFRRGCSRLLPYFNTNKPHSFFLAEHQLYYKTAGHLGGGVHTPCTLPLDPPMKWYSLFEHFDLPFVTVLRVIYCWLNCHLASH